MSQQWPGGLIRKTPPTPTGPFQDGAAPGVWTLDQMNYWLKQGLWPIAGNVFSRGLFGGGSNGNAITYINIPTTGNASDFGDLVSLVDADTAFSSATRGIFVAYYNNTMEYVTIATTGNATDFGDQAATLIPGAEASCSNATRGVMVSGAGNTNGISYVTIATTGNSTYFGLLNVAASDNCGLSSTTRGVFTNGRGSGTPSAATSYITIATTGNSINFGNLTVARYDCAAASSNTRGLFAGGYNSVVLNVIDYITIATTGNATDFGDLTVARYEVCGTSSPSRAVFAGGYTSVNQNVIDYVTIATTGNATDFGDLLTATRGPMGACSSSHGGL